VHDSVDHVSQFVTTFRFWTSPELNAAVHPREITVPGLCAGEQSLQIGPTGNHAVASLIDVGELGCKLVLVRFHPDLDSCSSHELQLPDGVDLGLPPNVLSLDDHRGVVWLFHGSDLLSIPYA
jgi:hypothetical protein